MTRTKLFQSNRSQSLRLSKAVAFPPSVHEVTIVRDGVRRVVAPANAVWDDFFESPGIDIGERSTAAQPPREPF